MGAKSCGGPGFPTEPRPAGRLGTERLYEPSDSAGAAKETQGERGSIARAEEHFSRILSRTKLEAENVLKGFYFRNFFFFLLQEFTVLLFCTPLASLVFPFLAFFSKD